MIENNNNNKGVSKQLMFAVVGVALLVIAVAGSAYAYFVASATSDGGVSGTTLNVKLDKPTVTLVSAKATGGLIPIYDGTVTGHECGQWRLRGSDCVPDEEHQQHPCGASADERRRGGRQELYFPYYG